MIEFIIQNFPSISSSIIGFCFVAYLGWRTILKQRRLQASDEFRKIILTEFSTLYPDGIFHIPDNEGRNTVKMLQDKHHIISAAVNSFRPHVSNKTSFDKAWNDFTGIDRFRDKDEKPRYNQYSIKNIQETHFYDSPKEMFVKNIDQLLKFTGHKRN